MASLAVIKNLDLLEDQIARVSAVSLCLMETQFQLEGGKEALHRGVIPALSLPAHALVGHLP